MKVTPLFQSDNPSGSPSDEEMLRFLDEPDDSAGKLAFLNRLALSESDFRRWTNLVQVVDAGKKLSLAEPDPSVRAHVLEVAFAEAEKTAPKGKRLNGGLWEFGWKWAWAALFLIFSIGVFDRMEAKDTILSRGEQMDEELLSLEQDIELLMEDLGFELDSYNEQV